jgi:type I restriction enzyme S subunit
MATYANYKPSNIPWVGDIPSHWNVVRLKYRCSLKGRIGWNGLKSEEFKEDAYAYLVTGQDFVGKDIDWSKCYQIDQWRYDEDPFIQLQDGDLLITKDGTIGKVAQVVNLDKPACLNSGIFVLKQLKGAFTQEYLYWTLVSTQLLDFTNYNSGGSTTIQHLYQNVFENMPLIIPPLEEQKVITQYLDQKCGSIDKVISAQEKRVEYLTELKNRIITDAVTKGINPDAAMKNSGVEWIGDIPNHWNVMPFKRCMRIYNGADYKHIESDIDNGYPVLGSGGVFAYALEYMYDGEALLLGRKGTIDRPLYINGKFWTVDTMYYSVPLKNAYCKYVYYQALNFPFKRYYTATALPSMTARDLNENPICLPPYQEQVQIVAYIEAKISPIESAIAKAKREIELLKEFKQSIITDAVTGKIKVYNL